MKKRTRVTAVCCYTASSDGRGRMSETSKRELAQKREKEQLKSEKTRLYFIKVWDKLIEIPEYEVVERGLTPPDVIIIEV